MRAIVFTEDLKKYKLIEKELIKITEVVSIKMYKSSFDFFLIEEEQGDDLFVFLKDCAEREITLFKDQMSNGQIIVIGECDQNKLCKSIKNVNILKDNFDSLDIHDEIETVFHPGNKFYISCFRSLKIYKNTEDEPLPLKWRTAKTKELLCYLLYNSNEPVSKKELINLLWPKLVKEKAHQQLYSMIYQIRSTLKNAEVPVKIESISESYIFRDRGISVDVLEFDKKLKAFTEITKENVKEVEEALALYTGDIFSLEDYKWVFVWRKKMQLVLEYYTYKVVDYYIKIDDLNEAMLTGLNMLERMLDSRRIKNKIDEIYTRI